MSWVVVFLLLQVVSTVYHVLSQGDLNRGGNIPVQVGRLRRPQVVVQVGVFCERVSARKTHPLVQKDYLRRSRNVYEGIAPTVIHALARTRVHENGLPLPYFQGSSGRISSSANSSITPK